MIYTDLTFTMPPPRMDDYMNAFPIDGTDIGKGGKLYHNAMNQNVGNVEKVNYQFKRYLS